VDRLLIKLRKSKAEKILMMESIINQTKEIESIGILVMDSIVNQAREIES
jgi:hypothetical protein